MVAFLNALRDTQSVTQAADSVGMGRQSAYKLRKRLAGQPFAAAWDLATEPTRLGEALAPVAGLCPVCRQPARLSPGFR